MIDDPFNYLEDFIVYTKSNCDYCIKVKELLEQNIQDYKIISCDKYLNKDKEQFLKEINKFINNETFWKTFPIVFYNGKFIGGFSETKKFLLTL
jgi:glutaredoxin